MFKSQDINLKWPNIVSIVPTLNTHFTIGVTEVININQFYIVSRDCKPLGQQNSKGGGF